jgi:hypothetical protein
MGRPWRDVSKTMQRCMFFFYLKALQTIFVGCVFSSLIEPRTKAKIFLISLHHFLFTYGYGFGILKAREANLRLPDLFQATQAKEGRGEGFGCIPETGWREEGEIRDWVTNFQKQGSKG